MAPGTRPSAEETIVRRSWILTRHLQPPPSPFSISESLPTVSPAPCLQYSSPEDSEKVLFNSGKLRRLLDAHDFEVRDWLYRLMEASPLFRLAKKTVAPGGRPFIFPDYSQSMEQQREITMRRLFFLESQGVFDGWLTAQGPDAEMRRFALYETCGAYDHAVFVKLGVHFFLW